MDEWIELLNYAHDQLKATKQGLATYDEDSEADHQDGQFCGREQAYKNIIRHCAGKITWGLTRFNVRGANMGTEEFLRSEIEGMSKHIIDLRRVIERAHEALTENRSIDAEDILQPYSDL